MTTFDEQVLRRASWREIHARATDGTTAVDDWADDAIDVIEEGRKLLPLVDLGETLINCYDEDPAFWGRTLPLVVVAHILAVKGDL